MDSQVVLASAAPAKGRRSALTLAGACALSAVLPFAAAPKASAAVIDTYNFTQGGYTLSGLFGATLTGEFTGSVEASGFIELADLSSISVLFTGFGSAFGSGPASFFSFDTTGGSSSLDLVIGFDGGGTACVGAAAAFGVAGCGSGGVNGTTGLFTTYDLPVVTLVSSVKAGAAPEASTWTMMLLGFFGLGYAGFRRVAKGCAVVR